MTNFGFLQTHRHRRRVCIFAAYTLLTVLLNNNRLYYANGIEIDEPQAKLPQSPSAIRDNSVNSANLSFSNQSNSLINSQTQTKHDRIRRNTLPTLLGNQQQLGNGYSPVPQQQQAQQQNLEGLLASCQLTNLLLYQLVNNQQQQKAALAPGLLAAPSSPFLSPLINPYLAPAAGPFLTTYITTSTYTTKMTSTDVITIPLLFGNKPSPTTVTRTKTYDVTTSTELTLTSTILPTTTTTTVIQVVPSAEAELTPTKASKYGTDSNIEASVIGGHYENVLNADEVPIAPISSKNKKKRKNRPSSQQKQARLLHHQDEFDTRGGGLSGSSPAYKFGQKQQLIELRSPSLASRGGSKFRRQYLYEDDPRQLENPDYYIADYYPSEVLHQNQQRLKRRGEVDPIDAGNSPDEFVLEPSFDSSSNFQTTEECPTTTTTVTVTTTRTVTKTKLINPATALASLVKESDALQGNNNINYEATNRAKTNFIPKRGNDRRGFSNKGRSTSSTSTTERSSGSGSHRSSGSKDRRRSSHRQRSTTPDSLLLSSSTNNYFVNNPSSDINSRRSRSRFHANYYAGRASY